MTRPASVSAQDWMQLAASMDAVEDSQRAIDAFFADAAVFDSEESSLLGHKYLRLYGVLQALFLQQDAVRHMLDAAKLGHDPLSDLERDDLRQVRIIRNEAVGHPTKLGRGTAIRYAFLVQLSMASTTFEYQVCSDPVNEPRLVKVNLGDLRTRQESAIERALSEIDEQLIALATDFELGDRHVWPD